MTIRTATMNDLNAITAVEAECFPAAEAASREEFSKRLTYYNDHFWLMFDEDKLIAFVDGFVTDEETLTDEMFHDASLHNPNGAWQMIFGVNTIPDYRKHGYAGQILHCRRKSTGPKRTCSDLQRKIAALLCKIRFCK